MKGKAVVRNDDEIIIYCDKNVYDILSSEKKQVTKSYVYYSSFFILTHAHGLVVSQSTWLRTWSLGSD